MLRFVCLLHLLVADEECGRVLPGAPRPTQNIYPCDQCSAEFPVSMQCSAGKCCSWLVVQELCAVRYPNACGKKTNLDILLCRALFSQQDVKVKI